MSARHAARVKAAQAAREASDDDEPSSDEEVPHTKQRSAFALLACSDDAESESEEESGSEEKEKDEQAVQASSSAPSKSVDHSPAVEQSREASVEDDADNEEYKYDHAVAPDTFVGKKLAKKARKRANKASAASVSDRDGGGDGAEDDLLAATAAANAAANAAHARCAAINAAWQVDVQALDAEREMQRKFGGRAVRAAQREMVVEARGRHGGGGGGRAAPTPRRVLFVAPKAEWGRPHGLFKMTARGKAGDGALVYGFEWSAEYVELHRRFEMLVLSSADPNILQELLRQVRMHASL